MKGSTELVDLATRVAGWARAGESLEVYVSRSTDTEVRVYEGEVESLSSATSAGAGIRVAIDGRQGFAYAGVLGEDVLAETLEEARGNAQFSSPEAWVGLPRPDGTTPVSLDLWRDELAAWPVQRKVDAALDLERVVRALDPRIRQVEWARWADSSNEMAVASSLGVLASDRSTACYLSAMAVAGEGTESKVAHGYTVGRSPSELVPAKAAGDAVSRAVRMLGATKPRSAHLPVVLEPRVSAQLLGLLGSVLSGERVLKGTSLFADRLGEAVAAPSVTLMDDPTEPAAWGASAFDDEGLACRRNVMIEEGGLRRFLYDSTSARRAGTASTASAVRAGYTSAPGVGARALQLVPGELSAEEVLAQVGDGLLVQSVTGLHSGVNLVSGDFSVGAEGLLVRGGELADPVRELTVASSIQRMLLGVTAVGDDLEWLPSRAAGVTLAISEMSMGGA
ncbi:MAG TPA: TldD/PmbA family protein [Acidimicrobiales bacterium]|nr:TldD/PmbA family protein [Acidimicrobiales bacterium]